MIDAPCWFHQETKRELCRRSWVVHVVVSLIAKCNPQLWIVISMFVAVARKAPWVARKALFFIFFRSRKTPYRRSNSHVRIRWLWLLACTSMLSVSSRWKKVEPKSNYFSKNTTVDGWSCTTLKVVPQLMSGGGLPINIRIDVADVFFFFFWGPKTP